MKASTAANRLIATLIQTVILNLLFELRLALAQCDHVTFEQGLILNALRAFKARILTRRSLLLLAWSVASLRQLGPIRDAVFALALGFQHGLATRLIRKELHC